MTIGIDARFWNETGVGRYIRNLTKYLQEIDKINQYVLFVKSKDESEFVINKKNWRIVPVDIPWHSVKEQVQFPKVLDQQNLDLMHFPYFSIPIFYNKPFIVTIHDLILHHFATGEATTKSKFVYHGKLLGYKVIIKMAAQKSRKIIAVSQATKQEIIDHLKVSSEKVAVIYEGIDDQLTSKVKSQKSKPQLKIQKYFLHVGNLYPHKNIELLIKAFELLKKQNFSVKLVVVGKHDFFHTRVVQTIKEKHLEDQIILLGEVNDEELASLYQHALALISSSVMEGFALPTVESMANNCLVLASDIPVHREICKNAAVYFQSNNAEDLMLKLIEISRSERSRFKRNLEEGQIVIKEYSWEKMARETLRIYESSLSL